MSDPLIPEIELELAFQIRVNFKERIYFQSPNGFGGYIPAASGEVWGPRLQGKVMPYSGGDYADTYAAKAHYMLEAADGTPIYIHNFGYMYPLADEYDPNWFDDPNWGADGTSFYFRTTPRFDCPIGPHDWLTRTIFVGTAVHYDDPDHTIFTYYAVK